MLDAGVEFINLEATTSESQETGNGLKSTWQDKDGQSHEVDAPWLNYQEATDETIELADLIETDDQLTGLDVNATVSEQQAQQTAQVYNVDNTANDVVDELLTQNTLID